MAKKTLKNILYVDVVKSDLKKLTLVSWYFSSKTFQLARGTFTIHGDIFSLLGESSNNEKILM